MVVTVVTALGVQGTAYDWQINMMSDLGDGSCRERGGRWICSPGFVAFNAGLMVCGVVLAGSALCLLDVWGRRLAGGIAVMGAGLLVAGGFPAGDDGRAHLAGVVLALVVPSLALLTSGIRPGTAWLRAHRRKRGLLGVVALVFCAESQLPAQAVPRGAGELIIVGCLVVALLGESVRLLAAQLPALRAGSTRDGAERRP